MNDTLIAERSKQRSRLTTSDNIRTLHRSSSQIVGQQPKTVSRQLSLDLKHGFAQAMVPGPLPKKQRLDAATAVPGGSRKEENQRQEASEELGRSLSSQFLNSCLSSDALESKIKLSPFPQRPSSNFRSHVCSSAQKENAIPSEVVQAKPYSLEPPRSAPLYSRKEPADFFPWTGKDPEDTLGEQSIKSGYFDKVSASQSELNSARPAIWSNFKHKSGLQVLSSLYITALDRKQDHCTVTPKSTFKPPPRATLTETKREIWLKDLADPNVPLRRLSRTIPHGIRGKVLLDQALAKRIPLWRTVWLAKCVGANEIRAFKRKGTAGAFASGGEAQWIRDWTISNEQFLEGLVGACGTEGWRDNLLYGLQLVATVFAEHLLDKEHFLDWIVSSMHDASVDRLPLWLLIANMHWTEIPIYWNRGRRLAKSLLEHALKLQSHGQVDANASLWQHISESVTSLLVECPTCFFLPDQWSKYHGFLRSMIEGKSTLVLASFDAICQRNTFFMRENIINALQDDSQQRIINALDAFDSGTDVPAISYNCLAITTHRTLLIRTTTEWASTRFRSGYWRVYLAARLIRRWSKSDVDLEAAILSSLSTCSKKQRFDRYKVYKMMSELIRSRHVSVPKLLQWIMAHNSPLDQEQAAYIESEFAIELLYNIPLYGVADQTLHLRQSILATYHATKPMNTEALSFIQSSLAQKIGFLSVSRFNGASNFETSIKQSLSQLDAPARYELLHWLRRSLMSYVSAQGSKPAPSTSESNSEQSVLFSHDLNRLCMILYEFEDFSFLADVLCIFAELGETALLGDIAEYFHKDFDTFCAIGAAQNIYETVLERLQEITARSTSQQPLIAAVVELTRLQPNRCRTLSILEKELSLCESRSTLSACSPISDSMGEVLQGPDTSFFEEIDMVFSSGTSMDKPLFSRIFADTLKRMEISRVDNPQVSSNFVEILARLRSFDSAFFEELLLTWIELVLKNGDATNFRVILATFICRGVIKLRTMFERICISQGKANDISANSFLELLAVLSRRVKHSAPCGGLHHCHVDIKQTVTGKPDLVAILIRLAIDKAGSPGSVSQAQFQEMFLDAHLQQILWTISRSEAALCQLPNGAKHVQCRMLLNDVLNSAVSGIDDPGQTVTARLQDLLGHIDYYNAGICGLKLKVLLNQSEVSEGFISNLESSADRLLCLVGNLTESYSGISHNILGILPLTIAKKIHENAVTRLMLLSSTPKYSTSDVSSDLNGCSRSALLSVVNVLEQCFPAEGMLSTFPVMVDNYIRFEASLSQVYSPTSKVGDEHSSALKSSQDQIWSTLHERLFILLRLLSIYQGLLIHPKLPQTCLSNLTIALCSICMNAFIQTHDDLLERTFDALALVSNSLTIQARIKCLHTIRTEKKILEKRINFLLGPVEQEDEEVLHLMTSDSHSIDSPDYRETDSQGQSSQSLPFCLRRWELVQDAIPSTSENDASLSLSLFNGRKRIFG